MERLDGIFNDRMIDVLAFLSEYISVHTILMMTNKTFFAYYFIKRRLSSFMN